jgi:hypothetical protein
VVKDLFEILGLKKKQRQFKGLMMKKRGKYY